MVAELTRSISISCAGVTITYIENHIGVTYSVDTFLIIASILAVTAHWFCHTGLPNIVYLYGSVNWENYTWIVFKIESLSINIFEKFFFCLIGTVMENILATFPNP